MQIEHTEREFHVRSLNSAISDILAFHVDAEDDCNLWNIPPSDAPDVQSGLSRKFSIIRKGVDSTAKMYPLKLGPFLCCSR